MYAVSFSILGRTFFPSYHTRKIEAFEQSSPKRSYHDQGRNHRSVKRLILSSSWREVWTNEKKTFPTSAHQHSFSLHFTS